MNKTITFSGKNVSHSDFESLYRWCADPKFSKKWTNGSCAGRNMKGMKG